MKGIIAEYEKAPLRITDDLELPEPSTNQILIRSLYTAVNPVYGLPFSHKIPPAAFSCSQLTFPPSQ
jgi:hypothetical protein